MIDAKDESRESTPRDLIVTIFGVYARDDDRSLSVAALVRLLADVGVEEGAVRSSIARLKKRNVLEPVQDGRGARYRPTSHGRAAIEQGDARIYRPRRAHLEDGWVLAVFSVPEEQRDRRHQLRTTLVRLGFGTVTAGVWAAPAHLEPLLRAELQRTDLAGFVEVFATRASDIDEARRQVASWWDVPRLRTLYEDFITEVTPVERSAPVSSADDTQAFRDYLTVLTRWRRLPFVDPGLPLEALPPQWPGEAAWRLFTEVRRDLEPAAERHVHLTIDGGRDALRNSAR
ncbi:MAG: PaaX family transcriptional regulator [Microbacteriaceae bacterium]|nr:PaaX family transcriptional regulator [Microbacteriaceae bacterium]